MRVLHVVAETPLSFLQHLRDITFIERKPLKCVLALLPPGLPAPADALSPSRTGSARTACRRC